MPVALRGLTPALAALLGGFLAAFVLTDPPGGRWAIEVSGRELDRWLGVQPTGILAGAVVAVAACAALQRNGSRRLAWLLAAAATAVAALVRLAVPEAAGVDTLIWLHLAKCIAAGALLGAAVAAAWGHRAPRIALTGGLVTGWTSVSAFGSDIALRSTSMLGEPSRWLLALTLAAALAAAVAADGASRITRLTGPEAGAALAAIAAIGAANRLLLAWIGRDTGGSRVHTWILIGIAIAAVLAVTALLTRAVAHRIGAPESALLPAATGVAAALMPVLVDLRNPFRDVPTWGVVLVAALAVAVGLVLAARLPNTLAGLAVAALVPLTGAVAPEFGNHGPWLLVRVAVLAIGAAWAVASTLPGVPALAAAGLSIPFVSTVFHAAATAIVPEPVRRVTFAYVEGEQFLTSEQRLQQIFGLPSYDDRAAGIALTIVVVLCGWGVHALRRHR